MEAVTQHDIRELQYAVERLNALNRQYDDGPYMTAAQFTAEWKAADRQYQLAAANLRSKGIEDEADLERADALLHNPAYQEPRDLGFVLVDDDDLDLIHEPSIE